MAVAPTRRSASTEPMTQEGRRAFDVQVRLPALYPCVPRGGEEELCEIPLSRGRGVRVGAAHSPEKGRREHEGEAAPAQQHDGLFPSPTCSSRRRSKVTSSKGSLKIPVTPSVATLGLRFNLFVLLRLSFSFRSDAGESAKRALGSRFLVGFGSFSSGNEFVSLRAPQPARTRTRAPPASSASWPLPF